jgi:hypothetical protein
VITLLILLMLMISFTVILLRRKTRIYWVNSVIWLSIVLMSTFSVSELQLNIMFYEHLYLVFLGLSFGVIGELVERIRV